MCGHISQLALPCSCTALYFSNEVFHLAEPRLAVLTLPHSNLHYQLLITSFPLLSSSLGYSEHDLPDQNQHPGL